MEYEEPDTSGTDDDDVPPSRRSLGNGGRSSLVSAPYSSRVLNTEMEAQVHHLEQEAYCAVLRAFKAQSDALSWEKEGLITELRKELRVSDDEHRELLSRVNADDIIRRIRDWRLTGGNQAPRHHSSQLGHDVLPSPSMSGSRKKQKSSQLVGQLLPANSMPSYPPVPPASSRQFVQRSSSGMVAEADPWVGKKVWTRWPEDNNFYEAVITDYNPVEGRHALVYDQNTPNETWEWVNLKECKLDDSGALLGFFNPSVICFGSCHCIIASIPADDIRWETGEPGIAYRGGYGVRERSNKNFRQGNPSGGRGRGPMIRGHLRKEILQLPNGAAKNHTDHIELYNTQELVQEAEKILELSNPNPADIAKYKKMLREQEQALVEAISLLPEPSDGESDLAVDLMEMENMRKKLGITELQNSSVSEKDS
ncbi:hypothetical protein ACFE04_003110 [Oxalis oulophora]